MVRKCEYQLRVDFNRCGLPLVGVVMWGEPRRLVGVSREQEWCALVTLIV